MPVKKIIALFVAINKYPIRSHRLSGCLNDAAAMKAYIEKNFDKQCYSLEVKELKDQEATRANVILAFDHFKQAAENDICLFFYSGHGAQAYAPKEFWHLEPDKKNETIVCYDSRLPEGKDLEDKELRYLVSKAVSGKKLHFLVIMDNCFSGSGTRAIATTVKTRNIEIHPETRNVEDYLGFEEYKVIQTAGGTTATPPSGNHILLSACSTSELAKEIFIETNTMGAFTNSLLFALKNTARQLTYDEIIARTNAHLINCVKDQSAQLERTGDVQTAVSFLSGSLLPAASKYFVSYDAHLAKWVMNAGAIQGISTGTEGAETRIRLSDGTVAAIEQTEPGRSIIKHMDQPDLTAQMEAVIEYMASSKIIMAYASGNSKEHETLFETFLSEAKQQNFSVLPVNEKALYLVHINDSGVYLTRTSDDRPLFKRLVTDAANFPAFEESLEKVAGWQKLLELENNFSTHFTDKNIKIQFLRLLNNKQIDDNDAVLETIDTANIAEFWYQYDNDNKKWIQPGFRLKITNTGKQKIFITGLYLDFLFGITNTFLQKEELEPGEFAVFKEKIGGIEYETVGLKIEQAHSKAGITQVKEYIKLVISTGDLSNTNIFNQAPLTFDMPDIDRGGVNKGGGRELAGNVIKVPDWTTCLISLSIIRPQEKATLAKNSEQILAKGFTINVPPGFSGQAFLSSQSTSYRSIKNEALPSVETSVLQPFELLEGINNSPGLEVLEIQDAKGAEYIGPGNPLVIKPGSPLANMIVPLGYDSESGLYYPLGYYDKKNEILIEQLPDVTAGDTRGPGGSRKIFFKKIVVKEIAKDNYPRLRMARVGVNGNVAYICDPKEISSAVASASNILLFTHGITGDTEDSVKVIELAKQVKNNKETSVNDLYDVVLTFNYEKLAAPLEQIAEDLKLSLDKIGLTAGHGKALHVVAHCIGGLIIRCFIELQDGSRYISHLIMLGTPNQGFTWPNVHTMATFIFTRAINYLPVPRIIIDAVALMNGRSKKTDDNFEQLKAGSETIKKLNGSKGSIIPYTVLVGNTSLINDASGALFAKMAERLGHPSISLIFQSPNDVAVSVQSMQTISNAKKGFVSTKEISCDHIGYFSADKGIAALAEVLFALHEATR